MTTLLPEDDQNAAALKAARVLMRFGLISQQDLADAMARQAEWGSNVGRVLIGEGKVKADQYYPALAEALSLDFVDLRENPPDEALLQPEDRHTYNELGVIPWRRDGDMVVVAAMDINPRVHEWARLRIGERAYRFVITTNFDILWQVQKSFERFDDHDAREGLYERAPQYSARSTFTVSQIVAAWATLSLTALCLWAYPRPTMIVIAAAVSLFYVLTFLFKFMLTWLGASRRVDVQVTDYEVRQLRDADLPVYTIMIPMYREAEVIPMLVESMRNLDYPKSKLDIKLVLEAGDSETIEAAKAVGAASIFEIIRVPHSHPKTKPKACNYSLRFARGDFVAIYDAEDIPEPDQLKRAVVAFNRSGKNFGCFQCRLNFFNRNDNFLTRMFTLEYSQWFDFLLPGLHALNVPIPLGGTSNHFRIEALQHLNAWDPYNVTEDADLGIRLNQERYKVGIINSTTFEEANGIYGSWIKQRSRWIKGYMQTWLVHMRNPVHLYRSLGLRGFLAFQFFIGGPSLVMLVNPWLWLCFALTLVWNVPELSVLFPAPVLYMALFNLYVANLLFIYFGIIAAFKRRYYDLVPYGLLQPAYWVLHSIAAYKGLWQLLFNPHYWEKTQHGRSQVTQAAVASATLPPRSLEPVLDVAQ